VARKVNERIGAGGGGGEKRTKNRDAGLKTGATGLPGYLPAAAVMDTLLPFEAELPPGA
jgi:uncharacterized protein YceK